MSENNNYDEDIQLDELNIKSHLNDSLELSGISVSEDLINRTLLAIKKQTELQAVAEINESQSESNTENQISAIKLNQTEEAKEQKASDKKVIHWNRYVRAFAGVAAAMVVVAVGYGLASNGAFSGYMASSSKDQSYDMATKEAADENKQADISESATIFQGEEAVGNALAPNESESKVDTSLNADYGDAVPGKEAELDPNSPPSAGGGGNSTGANLGVEAPQYSIVAKVPAATSKADSKESGSSDSSTGSVGSDGNDSSSLRSTAPSMKKSLTIQEITLSFQDIFLADPTQASTFTITDEINHVTVSLTKREDIQSFYTLMEKHQFTYGDQTGDSTNYTIELVTPEPSMNLYTMYIGTDIVVDYSDNATTSHSVYTTTNLSELTTAIEEFCQKYSK